MNLTDSISSNINETVSQSVSCNIMYNNVWFWIAIAEFCIIIILLFIKKKGHTEEDKIIKDKIMSGKDVDFQNLNESFFQAKSLYDLLKSKCHPDKFTDIELNRKATSLFQQINQNKHNYKKLCELKEQAIRELNINFKIY